MILLNPNNLDLARREHGFVANELEESALHAAEPSLGTDSRFGVQLPGHAWVQDPGAYVKALCAHAESQGATLTIAKVNDFAFKDSHLDADLFKLFLESGVYQTYAEKFLDPEQIDEITISDYLS